MKKSYYLSMPFLIFLLFFICGCCSHSGGGSGVSAVYQGDASEVVSRTVRIDENGRLPTITFPSGTVIEASEKNTLEPGIFVNVTEQKISSSQNSNFKGFSGSGSSNYLYKISAYLESSNKKTNVTTVEKPFLVTLSNTQSDTGLCYIAIRNSETDPWRFCRVNDDSLTNVTSLRLSSSVIAPKKCSFKLHRLGLSFALVVYNGEKTSTELPESAVDSLVASTSYELLVKDGKYIEDLEVKGIIKGVKVNSLNPSDFIAKITYRNNNSKPSAIKVNGENIHQTTSSDKTIPNYSYAHSFEVKNVSDSLLMNTEGEFVLTFNLKDVEVSSFASGFLIEFYNKIDTDNILPYVYSEFLSLSKVDSIKITLDTIESNIIYKENNLYKLNPIFTIVSNYDFNDSDKKKIADALTVSKIDSKDIEKNWDGKNLILSFKKNLNPDTTYTISLPKIDGLKSASLNSFGNFSFTTVGKNCEYSVIHQKENLDGGFTVVASETLEVEADSEVTPDVNSYTGFESPEKQKVKIVHGGENKIVYSYPRKEFTVTVVPGTGIKEVSGSGSYKYGANVIASYSLLDGYVFRNWTGDKTVSEFNMPEKDVTLQANAIKGNPSDGSEIYVITYILNGGQLAESSPTSYGENTETFSLKDPIREGCKFLGWVTPESETPQKTVTITKGTKGDKIYSANWEYESYHVTLIAGEGIASVTGEDDYLYTSNVTASCTMKDGYEFDSWTGDKTTGTFKMPAKAVTMTAKAKPINYQITYQNVNDEVNNPVKYNVTSDSITLVRPTRANYDFVGWTGTGISDSASMTLVIPRGSTGDRTYKANWVEIIVYDLPNGEKLQLNKCKPNTFAMGSPISELGRNDEELQHNVRLTNTFYMGKYEITQGQYKAIMGINPSGAPGEDDLTRPVDNVSWEDAMTFCEKLNQRLENELPTNYIISLPTEAMWEYACRANSTTSLNNYSNIEIAEGQCSNLDIVGWYKSNSSNETHPVGQKVPNAWGLHDMHGNVWEWCLDYYYRGFYDECVRYGEDTDPYNYYGDYGDLNVFRGGAYNSDPLDCRSATRIDHSMYTNGGGGAIMSTRRAVGAGFGSSVPERDISIGFRVCLMYYNAERFAESRK